MKINDLLIEDIAWTLRNFTAKIKEWEETPCCNAKEESWYIV